MNAEDQTTADALSKLTPGHLPLPIFTQITRLVVTPIIELVPLRLSPTGTIEILLLERPASDPYWPGQLHVPGGVILATDQSYDHVIARIAKTELGLNGPLKPIFVKNILHNSGRGLESAQVYILELTEPPRGTFVDATRLPDTLVQSQLDFIPDAIRFFSQRTVL